MSFCPRTQNICCNGLILMLLKSSSRKVPTDFSVKEKIYFFLYGDDTVIKINGLVYFLPNCDYWCILASIHFLFFFFFIHFATEYFKIVLINFTPNWWIKWNVVKKLKVFPQFLRLFLTWAIWKECKDLHYFSYIFCLNT